MAKILIDYARALELVNDEIAKEGPDYVYPKVDGFCVNTVVQEDGTIVGSCLVGRALIGAGVEASDLDRFASDSSVESTIEAMADYFQLTTQAAYFLSCVQQSQDTGSPWGEAVENAVRIVHDEDGGKRWNDTFNGE